MLDNAAAAKLLDCKESEVASVADAPAGLVIATTDGTGYVLVPDDQPDAEGKTGLMLLSAPSEKPVAVVDGCTLWNAFPVYVSPVPLADEESADAEEVAEVDAEARVRSELDERGIGELRDLAKARDLDVDMRSKQAIVDALVAAEVSDAVGALADDAEEASDG